MALCLSQNQFDRNKLKELIVYVCGKCSASDLGAVKLHKVLYFSDMLYYSEAGTPITGAVYRKRPFGPTCDALLPSMAELQRDGRLQINRVNYFGYIKNEYHALDAPDTSRFSKEQIALVDEVIDFVCKNNTANSISEFSHNRAWEAVDFGDEIDYFSVFNIFPNQVSQEALDWASEELDQVEASRPSADPLVLTSYADFRKRVLEKGR